MRSFAVALFFAIALAHPVSASHCASWSTSEPWVDAAGFYAFFDGIDCPAGCWWLPYVYQESNGIEGLQRLDEIVDDTCHGMIAPDTLIF